MTNQIRSGLAICSRRRRLVSATRSAPARMVASSLAVLMVAAGAGLLGGGHLLAQASSAGAISFSQRDAIGDKTLRLRHSNRTG